MRENRSSGSVEGVMGNHDSYSDSARWMRSPEAASSERKDHATTDFRKETDAEGWARGHPAGVEQMEMEGFFAGRPHKAAPLGIQGKGRWNAAARKTAISPRVIG